MRHFRQIGLVVAILGPSFGLGMAARWWAPPTSEARFDWFTYEGNDSVYRKLDVGPSRYTNPILSGFYPDPSMIRVGDNYYLVTSSFAYFPGLPIFQSGSTIALDAVGPRAGSSSQLKLDSAGISRGCSRRRFLSRRDAMSFARWSTPATAIVTQRIPPRPSPFGCRVSMASTRHSS
jgi:hypothetical protein